MLSPLQRLVAAPGATDAAAFAEGLGLWNDPGRDGRPRVVVAMIGSADGRATVDGRAGGLGSAADRDMLRELRTAAGAVLAGSGTLVAEGYATILDPPQQERRAARGLPREPLLATISRRLDPRLFAVPLFAEPGQAIVVYTESEDDARSSGADVATCRLPAGALTPRACLEHLYAERGVRVVAAEGGPTLLRELVAGGLVDDLVLTVSPLLVAGDGLGVLSGPVLDPPAALRLADVLRGEDHLFLHYVPRGLSTRTRPMPLLPTLRAGDRVLEIERGRPLVMGIVNAGPDSFSDSTRLHSADRQVEHALALVADGADIIDVGGESGVTYTSVTAEEVEIERVVPVVRRLADEGVLVSVDTWKPAVARAATAAGAAILNDVSGLADLALADVAAASGAALVVMHTRARPKEEHFPDYGGDVVGDVERFLRERLALAAERGVGPQQLIVDPGPDFAKTPEDSAAVLRALGRLHALGRPILLPVSRKYVIGAITGRPPGERLAGTLAALLHGAAAGAAIVRVHDVAAATDALRVWRVLEGLDEVPPVDPGDDGLKWIRADAPG